MTTEQCSVDSLLQKSRRETFARQLQNRLRTLSGESERDGLEDTSWNGDQLSSSSDNDIYYDLDSYSGSPAEEATDTSFPEFINVKNAVSTYPSSSTNFLNHNELSLHENDKIDCGCLQQYCRSEPLSNCKNISVVTTCVCITNPDRECSLCSQCSTSQTLNDISVPSMIDSIKNSYSCSSNQNGLLNSIQSPSEQFNSHYNKKGQSNDVNNLNNIDSLKAVNENNRQKNIVDHINNRLESDVEETDQNHTALSINGKIFKENKVKDDLNECCSCISNKDDVESTPVDVNSNSTTNNNNSNTSIKNSSTELMMTVQDACTSLDGEGQPVLLKNNIHDVILENGHCTMEDDKQDNSYQRKNTNTTEQFSEDALCRLVDVVFSKSQEKIVIKHDSTEVADCNETIENIDESNKEAEREEETIESKRARFRRSSSLKTGKTPPGTPSNKKIVRFADVLGLDLADVRTFLDEIPKIPKSAYTDLKNVDLSSSPPVNPSPLDYLTQKSHTLPSASNKLQRTIVPLFQQPSSRPDFFDRVRDNFVCLEKAIVSDTSLFVITGFVRVKNIDFHKSVYIRYSIDNWKSFADLQGKYIPDSCDGFSDKFMFVLYAHMLNIGQRLEFAVRYHARGSQYWDNNYGANYTFQCIPEGQIKFGPYSSSYVPPVETWAASFY
ncbi:glycogen binding subunit 76A [Lycorma delicatula]|uniref:glycogen binding subunit 76A n=1 Tax=Lycorma delicatula TaxID=130591 RepID=UPI003F515B98